MSQIVPLRLGNVLLVEDEVLVAMELTSALKDMGYTVLEPAVTGEDAVRLANRLRPDVIVMDVSLPGELSGTQAAQVIHDRFQIPVVYLTGYANRATLAEIRMAGGGDVLGKPVRIRQLDAAIQQAIDRRRGN
jgi:CheY-like chemotaxis protein